jgi:hypothetical protein
MKTSVKYVSLVALLAGAALVVTLPVLRAQEDKPAAEPPTSNKEAGDDQLLLLLKQLQEEVQSLRREVAELREQRGRRDGDAPREGAREDGPRDGEPRVAGQRRPTQTGRIFDAYDKNKDRKVSFEEWLSMKEGEFTPERKALEFTRFLVADTERDDGLTFEEFASWMENRGRIPETALRSDFLAFDAEQYTMLVKVVGRSGEGGTSTPDGEQTFNVARNVVILLEKGEAGKLSDLTVSAPVQLTLSLDGKQVIAIQRIRKDVR